ncbi:protein NRT1/ PTR FAMILY 7.3-like [Miscanthus floridulus]|uniref:protein NRT1/ PTR FAMILY 7.3-like n=1 Tax=Miscanthus floridulus TaxID=154761 RepID=UPI0034579FE6
MAEGSWTPTAELPLQQAGTPGGEVEEHGGGGAAAEAVTATRDGSVGWSGEPCRRDRSGGWFAGFLMLANQALVTFAVNCVGTNLVTFMSVVMRLDNADAANKASNWNGTTYVFSIIGAIVSDSYWGRYKACTIFQLIFLAGLVELAVACHVFLDKSCHFGNGGGRQEHCKPPTTVQAAVFYVSIYQIALGNGGYQPAANTFGADQFDETDARERKSKSAFFGYFFVANNLGGILAVTALAYMEDKGEWVQAFWIATAAALLGYLLFAVGTLRYRHFLASGNAVVSVCQVVVAAVRNRRRVRASVREQDLYDPDAADGAHVKTGVRKMVHTPEYWCLDKAAVIKDPSALQPSSKPNPWRLCTLTQVEELKCILRLVPIWLCSILFSTSYSQMTSVFIEQAQAMDDSLWKLKIPPAGMDVFEILGVTAFVFIYRFCIVKIMTKISHEPTELQRMGTGLVISTAAMITSGVVEQQRLIRATTGGVDASSSLSILWQTPQYLLIGASEVFMYVTMTEFFNDQLPEGLRSLGSAMSVASMSAGSFASSLLVTLVMTITCRGGRPGWIPQDLNKGHVDWFFYLIAALNAVDLLAFVVFAKRYRPAPVIIHGASESGVEKGHDGEECI